MRLEKRKVEERVQKMVVEVTSYEILQGKHEKVCAEKAELEGRN